MSRVTYFKVCVAGKRRTRQCHRVQTLTRAKEYARIGATKGRRDRVVYRCTATMHAAYRKRKLRSWPTHTECRVVKRYKAGR